VAQVATHALRLDRYRSSKASHVTPRQRGRLGDVDHQTAREHQQIRVRVRHGVGVVVQLPRGESGQNLDLNDGNASTARVNQKVWMVSPAH